VSRLARVKALPEKLRAHLADPRNVGTIADASGSGRGENAACGDVLEITVAVEAGKVERILFQARACGAVIATASLVTDLVRGLSVEEARALDVETLVREAGGVPPGRSHAPRVVERALREALG
jgi:nitrogen fixation NifU-like protein